ncbi:MAG: tetratricopeptide repeat protein [Bacteroides sp.]
MIRQVFLGILLLLLAFGALGQEAAKFLRKGNGEYKAGKYYEAELEYRKAQELDGASSKAQFNLGASLFQQEKYDEALKSFQGLAGRTDLDASVRASSLYNLGNTYFKQKQYKESLAAYKEALRLEPDSKDIKYNMSAALRKLQEEQQQDKKDQDNKENQDKKDKNNQDKQGEGKDKQDDQNSDQNKDQNKDQKDKGQQDKDNKSNQDKDQNKEQQQQQSKPQDGSQGQDRKEKSTMSQEDAAQLLKALENQESALQAKIQKEKAKAAAKVKKTDKDW